MTLLAFDNVGFARGKQTLLDGISLAIAAGSRTLVMGPNGAGKTLLLRLGHGLLAPSTGRVRWNGVPPRQAMVFQRPVMLRRSALANITHALELAGVPRRQRRERARAALADLGLDALAARPARALSGGEQQRLALARSWALAPDVLFLDEPTASLDPASAAAIEATIQRFHAAGMTILMSTHDLGQARRLADTIAFVNRGRLEEHTSAADFFDAPRTEAGRRFTAGELIV